VVFIIICLSISVPVYSQGSIRFGIDAGVNFADQTNTFLGQADKASQSGLAIGGLSEVRIADVWYLQLEPRYIQKDLKEGTFIITGESGPEVLGTEDLVLKMEYLEIPVLIKAKFGNGDLKPFIFAGPNIGFLLSAKNDLNANIQEQGSNVDVKADFKSLDLSIDLGAGGEYQVYPTVSLFANARYSLGLSDLNNTNASFNPTIRSQGIQILMGILFTL